MKDNNYKFRLSRFTRSRCVMDLRDPLETRKARAARAEKKNKLHGKKAVFHVYD